MNTFIILCSFLMSVIINHSQAKHLRFKRVGTILNTIIQSKANTTSHILEEDDERWIWGFADDSDAYRSLNEAITRETASSTTELNPCNLKPPKMPDFSSPSRRLSTVKCYEYIWELKEREAVITRAIACNEYTKRKKIEAGEEIVEYGGGIGGSDTSPGEYPHMGAVGWEAVAGGWIFKCGGSLISSKYLLTAGHCSKASDRDTSIADVNPKIVRLADKNILDYDRNGYKVYHEDKKILRFINHPQYNPPKKYFDISLIELTEDVKFTDYVQPACLYTGADVNLLGRKANMTGWGVVETVTRRTSPELQAVQLDVLSSEQCNKFLEPSCSRNWCGMQENQLCAGKLAGGADACQGDSGGPLQFPIPLPKRDPCIIVCRRMHMVIGVTSFGVGCALPNMPGVYTSVSSFVDWIEDIVWK